MALVLRPARSRRHRYGGASPRLLFALGGAVLAGVVLASCGSSSPTASSHNRLSAPVIVEHFTRLPCNHDNTIGLEGCAETQLLEADHRIDREVKLLFSLIPSGQRKKLATTESEFMTYRRDTCTTYSSVYQGGSFAPVEYALCEVRVDDAQSSVLHGYFQLAEAGASHSLAWP
ncbi:MAG TPA: lysozyme inhibitor LprI family protein [Acidimicrobiales bacterium]|nr:lysozyme inhibitor LprI family protein [Acidimicrobiales bacterium]